LRLLDQSLLFRTSDLVRNLYKNKGGEASAASRVKENEEKNGAAPERMPAPRVCYTNMEQLNEAGACRLDAVRYNLGAKGPP